MRPWRRQGLAAVAQVVLALMVGYVVFVFSGFLGGSPPVIALTAMFAAVAFVPWTFVRFARRGTPQQIEELYLTLLTRREVFFESWIWAAGFALFCGGLIALGAMMANYFVVVRPISANLNTFRPGLGAEHSAAMIALMAKLWLILLLFFSLVVLKALRIWLLLDDKRWMIVPGTFMIMLPDFLLIGMLLFTSWATVQLFWLPLGLLAMIAWNYKIAVNWGMELFYRKIEAPRLRDLFMGRYFAPSAKLVKETEASQGTDSAMKVKDGPH